MRNRENQIYEDYWKYTAAWTDVNGEKFITCLRTCIDFFDRNGVDTYREEDYYQLQDNVIGAIGFTGNGADASARKGINQLVKLGFLKPYLQGYNPEAKLYVEAATDRRRTNLLSKVVYNYSNFQNSISDPEYDSAKQIQFLLKTLEEVGAIDKRALISLMTIDINDYPRGYLCKDELDELYEAATDIAFIDRKYNQLGHLLNLLGRLDDLCNHDGVIYFKTDADRLFGNETQKKVVRDPYLQRVYKAELEEETCIHYQCETPKCMLDGFSHPVLIASHIKPYSHCEEGSTEQFDLNNGLLLNKAFDSLFDLGYITFTDEGVIMPSKTLDVELKNYLSAFTLHKNFLNSQRLAYMEYHRANVFEKRYSVNVRRYNIN